MNYSYMIPVVVLLVLFFPHNALGSGTAEVCQTEVESTTEAPLSGLCAPGKCGASDCKEKLAEAKKTGMGNCQSLQGCESTGGSACSPSAGFIQTAQQSTSTITTSVQDLVSSGDFGATPCSEMNSCLTGGAESLASPSVLNRCGRQLDQATYETVLEEYGGPEMEAQLQFDNGNVVEALKSKNYVFEDPAQFNNLLKANPGADLKPLVNSQSYSTLMNPAVKGTMQTQNIGLYWYNEAAIWALEVSSHPAFKIASIGISAGSTLMGMMGGGQGQGFTPRTSTNYNPAQTAASNHVSTASNSISQASSASVQYSTSPTAAVRLPACAAGTWIHDPVDGAYQCKETLHSGNSLGVGSIIVIDNTLQSAFTLKGINNHGIIYEDTGYVNIHRGGTTQISVGSDQIPITDHSGNRLFLAGGTHVYHGVGSDQRDVFTSDTIILNQDAQAAVLRTDDRDGEVELPESIPEATANAIRSITGKATYDASGDTFALSMDHFNLPNYENAFDLSATVEGYQILARGFGDMVLLGREKLFPLLSRGALKGDTDIVFNKNVKVNNQYVARDGTYDYIITPTDSSTQVIARSGKIIQDSGGIPRDLTARQQRLLES